MSDTARLPRVLLPARLAAQRNQGHDIFNVQVKPRVLMVDLNNFSSFPTYAIGLLIAALRNKGHRVQLLSPLAHDVPAIERERQETIVDHVQRRIHLADWKPFIGVRDFLREAHARIRERPHPTVLREVRRALAVRPDVILLSAYLQHFSTVREIGRIAQKHGIPVLLGGPMFNIQNVAGAWADLPGLTAIVGAEVDLTLPDIVQTICDGKGLEDFKGVTLPNGVRTPGAVPLRDLNSTPVPDFTDFPWDRYPARIIPLMTGRGCQWDKCNFCSDVISVSGRTFRTRSVESVLLEMQEQARRHLTTSFLFLDLKLNSYPDMLRGIADGIGRYVRGSEWIGTVHVDQRRDNGLSRADLMAAAAGGMRRISFGLESGSQRLLDLMEKGTTVEKNRKFIRDSYDAGLSIRCTMFKGFPGENADDMEKTANFLEENVSYLDRILFNDFSVHEDTPIYHALSKNDGTYRDLIIGEARHQRGRILYRNTSAVDPLYRKAKARALAAVFAINRRPLRNSARQFDGLM